MSRIDIFQFIFTMSVAALLAGCAATVPPPLPPKNPANPQVRSSSKTPCNLLVPDQTTLAIEKELSATEADAKAAETMKHDMQNMPGMQHEGMKMEQHDQMKQGSEMTGHEGMQHGKEQPQEKKALENEMKKTSDEMKATSDGMKKKSDEIKGVADIYTCPMHPQIKSDKPGKCPICGMTLKKKEG
jgi:rubrerythrin